jgi:hypothetical protein
VINLSYELIQINSRIRVLISTWNKWNIQTSTVQEHITSNPVDKTRNSCNIL